MRIKLFQLRSFTEYKKILYWLSLTNKTVRYWRLSTDKTENSLSPLIVNALVFAPSMMTRRLGVPIPYEIVYPRTSISLTVAGGSHHNVALFPPVFHRTFSGGSGTLHSSIYFWTFRLQSQGFPKCWEFTGCSDIWMQYYAKQMGFAQTMCICVLERILAILSAAPEENPLPRSTGWEEWLLSFNCPDLPKTSTSQMGYIRIGLFCNLLPDIPARSQLHKLNTQKYNTVRQMTYVSTEACCGQIHVISRICSAFHFSYDY